jgi:D-3-phosphoglycerate dehydrogenase
MNTSNSKHVFYFNQLAHRSFADVVAARPNLKLTHLANASAVSEVDPVLAIAHVYQIGSARDELAPAYHAHAAFLTRAPNLLLVSTNGAGYDTVDVAACTAAGVLVVNQAGGNREAVAEHALAMLLCLSKRLVEADRAVRRGGIASRESLMGRDAFGKTIGIIGLGHVGRRVAELCRLLLGMRVLACDPYLSQMEVQERGAEKVALDDLLRRSDFVSVNCPLTPETRGMIGAREYGLMQPHAYFITTARGHIHDEAALVDALRREAIAGAGLDVWEKEPPPTEHPLLQFDNVVVSPHTAGVTHEARENIGRIAAEQVLQALDGMRPARIVNPEAWDAYARRFQRVFGFAPGDAALRG